MRYSDEKQRFRDIKKALWEICRFMHVYTKEELHKPAQYLGRAGEGIVGL
ncbi:hypothetical protein C7460_1343 [Marinoscillum furvescens DSM 4134]|uniref:Uncharacterized protein n=1 Tax=Marinoscillum furvescens DSM 4134 TaxID=1122208 RepID=A0A3D9KVZ6_MARFU|nr:hypothetical protein C7460_1343 [Marinoscillum furvescens DSM 4134]